MTINVGANTDDFTDTTGLNETGVKGSMRVAQLAMGRRDLDFIRSVVASCKTTDPVINALQLPAMDICVLNPACQGPAR